MAGGGAVGSFTSLSNRIETEDSDATAMALCQNDQNVRIAILLQLPDKLSGLEITTHLSSDGLRRVGHEVLLVHGSLSAPSSTANYAATLALPRAFSSGHAGHDVVQQLDRWLHHQDVDVVHVRGFPSLDVLEALVDTWPTVISANVPICPNGARYHWKTEQPCNREIGLGCLTTGYRTLGCGHTGDGQPYSLAGFVLAMQRDLRRRRIFRRSRGVIAPSNRVKRRLVADGMSVELVTIVAPPLADVAADLPSSSAKPPVVLFVGRLHPFKGVAQLLSASKLTAVEHHLVIIGVGPDGQRLEALARKSGIAERCHFIGELGTEALAHWRDRATIAVVPSLWQEAWGRVGPEAMAAGLPVIAFDVGGISDWCRHEETGVLVRPGDTVGLARAIDRLLENHVLCRRLGSSGQNKAREWLVDNLTEDLASVYIKATARSQSPMRPAVAEVSIDRAPRAETRRLWRGYDDN